MTDVKTHPARDALRHDYNRNPSSGDYIARHDHHAWGDDVHEAGDILAGIFRTDEELEAHYGGK